MGELWSLSGVRVLGSIDRHTSAILRSVDFPHASHHSGSGDAELVAGAVAFEFLGVLMVVVRAAHLHCSVRWLQSRPAFRRRACR